MTAQAWIGILILAVAIAYYVWSSDRQEVRRRRPIRGDHLEPEDPGDEPGPDEPQVRGRD